MPLEDMDFLTAGTPVGPGIYQRWFEDRHKRPSGEGLVTITVDRDRLPGSLDGRIALYIFYGSIDDPQPLIQLG